MVYYSGPSITLFFIVASQAIKGYETLTPARLLPGGGVLAPDQQSAVPVSSAEASLAQASLVGQQQQQQQQQGQQLQPLLQQQQGQQLQPLQQQQQGQQLQPLLQQQQGQQLQPLQQQQGQQLQPQQQQQWQQLQPLQQQQGQQLQPLQQQQGQQLQPLQQGQMQSQLLSDQGIQQFPTQEQPLQPPQAAAAPAAAPFMMPYEINEAPYRQQEPLMNSNPAPIPQLQADLIDTKANSSPKGGRLKDSATEGARNSTEGSKSKEMKERSTTFAWWSWMIIAFLSFLAIGGLLYYTDYMYHKQHYSGMPNKVLGQVVSAELRTKLDRACFVTVQCGKDDDTVLETRAVAGSGGVVHWNDHFRYSVSPEKARDHPLRKTAIKLTLYQNSDDGAKSLGSGEISCSSLKDVRMNGGVMEAHNVTISRFGIVIVKAGLGFSGWSEQKVDRLRASWRKKRSEISFWTRLLLSPAEATLLILKGIEGITHLHNFILSVFDLAVAATIVILTLPFLLNYVGLSMFDKLKIKELRWTWTTYSSLSGTGILLWRLFGTFPAFWHLGLYCGLGLLALLFMIADFRGESGSGVISRAVGKVAGWFGGVH